MLETRYALTGNDLDEIARRIARILLDHDVSKPTKKKITYAAFKHVGGLSVLVAAEGWSGYLGSTVWRQVSAPFEVEIDE